MYIMLIKCIYLNKKRLCICFNFDAAIKNTLVGNQCSILVPYCLSNLIGFAVNKVYLRYARISNNV